MAQVLLQSHHERAQAPGRAGAGLSSRRYAIEAILFSTYAVFGVSWIGVTPLLGDIRREFDVGMAALAMLNTMVAIAKIVAPLVTGVFAVRFGLKRTILLGSALITLSVATPFAPGFGWFLASRFVFGVGGAMVVTLLAPMVMQWFAPSELPIVNALNNVAVNTGIALTLFITVPLSARLGWRHTLLAYALVSAALCVAWALVGRDRESPPPSAKGAGASSPSSPDVRLLDVWRIPETWLVALGFAAPLALYLALNTWLPRYYVEVFGMPAGSASRYTGLINLCGIPSAIAGGVLTRRFGRRRPFVIGAGALIGFAAFGVWVSPNPMVLAASAVLLGVAFFIAASPLFTTAMELPGMTPRHVTLMMGTVFSSGYLVSALAPLIVGWLRDRTGSYVPGLALWSTLSWLVLPAGVWLRETGPGAARRS